MYYNVQFRTRSRDPSWCLSRRAFWSDFPDRFSPGVWRYEDEYCGCVTNEGRDCFLRVASIHTALFANISVEIQIGWSCCCSEDRGISVDCWRAHRFHRALSLFSGRRRGVVEVNRARRDDCFCLEGPNEWNASVGLQIWVDSVEPSIEIRSDAALQYSQVSK